MRLGFFLLLLAALAGAQAPDCAAIPGSQQDGPVRNFDTETLFEYMNGNSEGYFLYGFRTMQGITCAKGEVKLIFDVSTFADFESAYGMFTGNMDPRKPTVQVGAIGQVTPRKATFVKDKYYVEIAAEPEGDHTALLHEAIGAFAKRIEGQTEAPRQLAWFPKEGVQAGYPRLVPQSVLGLRLLKRGYMATYPQGKAFVVTEASAEEAAALMKKLAERFTPSGEAKVGDAAFLAEDRYLGKMCLFRKGSFVAGWTGVKDGDPTALATALAGSLP